jgi:hypothetical protein
MASKPATKQAASKAAKPAATEVAKQAASTEVAVVTRGELMHSKQELAPVVAHDPSFFNDFELPRLNVIQKMSEIVGPLGSVVIDKGDVLLEQGVFVNVVVAFISKKWREDVPFDSDVMARMANTEAEARQLAAESDFDVIEVADIALLIPETEGSGTTYPYPIGGVNYQIGKMTVQKDAYRMTFKRLFTFQALQPNVRLGSFFWKFGTELLTKGKYSWYVPTLSLTKEVVPDDVAAFAARLTGG